MVDTLLEEAQAFFDRYGRDFDLADWPAFCAHYCEPAFSVRADGTVAVLGNWRAVEQFFSRVWSTWRQEGYGRFSFSDLSVAPVGGQSVLTTLTWHLLRADGSEIRQWDQSYQLLQVAGAWKVLSSTFHRERA
jgi:ketosteroid isomerase-like protein